MGLLDGLIGGAVGAALSGVVGDMIEKHGGVAGIAKQLQSSGLGQTVQSWIGHGPNQPVTGAQVHQAFGADTINEMAAKVGMSPEELSHKLAEVLPQAVDKLTPDGKLPGA